MHTLCNPEALGISSSGLLSYLDALSRSGMEVHSMVILRHGQVACEMAWSPYTLDHPHQLFSLSKSFTSAAIGLAVSEGLLSYDDTVAELLPDKMPDNPSERHGRITVRHLLCMASGLDQASDSMDPGEPDWAKHTLSYDVVYEPGTEFQYNSMGTFLLSEILQRLSGVTLRDYLTPRLFAPLAISTPHWMASPMGVSAGGFGLMLSTRQIARFGQLLLQDGIWAGQRLLPEGWVQEATRKHIDSKGGSQDWLEGYGYQFWRCQNGFYRGDGMHGQICMVLEDLDAVIAINAWLQDMGGEMQQLHDHIIPAFDALPAGLEAQQALQKRLAQLAHPFPAAGIAPEHLPASGTYVASSGKQISIHMQGSQLQLTLAEPASAFFPSLPIAITAGLGAPVAGTLSIPFDTVYDYYAAYGWQPDGAMQVLVRMPGMAGHTCITLIFGDKVITVSMRGTMFDQETAFYRRQD